MPSPPKMPGDTPASAPQPLPLPALLAALPPVPPERDHGGDLARAMALHGGARADWLDLSTGINPWPWPAPPAPPDALTALPDAGRLAHLCAVAQAAYGAPRASVVPAAGAQALIELIPRLLARAAGPDRLSVAICTPTYNEHAAAWRAVGADVHETGQPGGSAAQVITIVTPNNPDGRVWPRALVQDWLRAGRVVIIDESFADTDPALSLADLAGPDWPGLVVLRSFGKFYGLAGLRLGFALCAPALGDRMRAAAGLWSVSGPAIEAGITALADRAWADAMRPRLEAQSRWLADTLQGAGGRVVGRSALFVTISHDRARGLHDHLARARIWTRAFPARPDWLRLGLPGAAMACDRLRLALAGFISQA